MQMLREIVEPSLGVALSEIGVTSDFWKNALGPSREKSQGDLSLPCFGELLRFMEFCLINLPCG